MTRPPAALAALLFLLGLALLAVVQLNRRPPRPSQLPARTPPRRPPFVEHAEGHTTSDGCW